MESQDPKAPLVPQDLPQLLWMSYLMALQITILALHLSSVKTRLLPTATPPPLCRWTLVSLPPWRLSAARSATWRVPMAARNIQLEPVMTWRDATPWRRVVSVKPKPVIKALWNGTWCEHDGITVTRDICCTVTRRTFEKRYCKS